MNISNTIGSNVAVVPARGGSKGIKNKNIRTICGKPLLAWTIEAALQSSNIDSVVVSSDSGEILEIATHYGAFGFRRPKRLANDDVHAIHTVINFIEFCEERGIILDRVGMFLPTAPLRTYQDIDNAFDILDNKSECTSVVGVSKCDKPESNFRYIVDGELVPMRPVTKFEIQRQDISNPIYEVSGAMFLATKAHIKKYNSYHSGSPLGLVMSKINSIDINSMDDFYMAELLMKDRWGNL